MPFDYAQLGQNLGQNLSQDVSFDPFGGGGGGQAIARRAAPAPRGTEAGEAIDLKRQQFEAFQSEMAQAQAEYEARVTNIRPYLGETVEQLHDQILKPVLEKWGSVPGFQRPTAEHYQELKLKQEASEAARQYEGQMRVSQLIKGGMDPEKAILENSQFFAPTVQSAALRTRRPAPAALQAVPVPGMQGVMAVQTPDGRTVLHNQPAAPVQGRVSPINRLTIQKLDSRRKELQSYIDKNADLGNRDASKAGPASKAFIADYQRRKKELEAIEGDLEKLLPTSKSDEETAQPEATTKRFTWTPGGLVPTK